MTPSEKLKCISRRLAAIYDGDPLLACEYLYTKPENSGHSLIDMADLGQYQKVLEHLIYIDSDRRRWE